MQIDEKYFKSENRFGSTVEDVLEKGEKILWQSKPQKSAYVLAAVFKMLPIALLWLVIDGGIISVVASGIGNDTVPKNILWFIVPFFALHLIPVWIWIAGVVKAAAELKNIEYVFTQKRIIIRTGLIGIDFKYIYYDAIESVNVKVGLIDRICKVGDIYITAPSNSAVLYDQTDPYRLATKLQKIAHDIRTDVNFPNALRPETNPGYNTHYDANVNWDE